MVDDAFIRLVLKTAYDYDIQGELFWHYKASSRDYPTFSVACSDVFWWGTADGEDITPENLPQLVKACSDSQFYGPVLFCARQRKIRPQGAWLATVKIEKDKAMFLECGPEREINIANPMDIDGQYLYKSPDRSN